MHIIHVNFARGFRGGERQTLNLIQGLADRGYEQSLVARDHNELLQRAAEQSQAAIIPSLSPFTGHRKVPATNLIHVHEGRGIYWAWLEHRLRGTPYLVTRRVVNPVSSRWITTRAYAEAALLVGVSSHVAQCLHKQTDRHVEVVMDACSSFDVDRVAVSALRERLGPGPIIGHVGVLDDAVKGQSTLITAFKYLLQHWPDARLVLIGAGPDEAKLKEQASGNERILFAGYQKNVETWIAAMDVFAFPSHIEALGSSILDAMALGVPVVGSSTGGLPELIGDQERGLLVNNHYPTDWCNALQTMLNNDKLRQRLSTAARHFAQEHDIGAMTRHYEDLYARIMDGIGKKT